MRNKLNLSKNDKILIWGANLYYKNTSYIKLPFLYLIKIEYNDLENDFVLTKMFSTVIDSPNGPQLLFSPELYRIIEGPRSGLVVTESGLLPGEVITKAGVTKKFRFGKDPDCLNNYKDHKLYTMILSCFKTKYKLYSFRTPNFYLYSKEKPTPRFNNIYNNVYLKNIFVKKFLEGYLYDFEFFYGRGSILASLPTKYCIILKKDTPCVTNIVKVGE